MFPVRDWAVSASELKTQTKPKVQAEGSGSKAHGNKQSKKRKRFGDGVGVTHDNVGELYKHIIEGKTNESAVVHAKGKGGDPALGESIYRKKTRKDKHRKSEENFASSDHNVSRLLGELEQRLKADDPIEPKNSPENSQSNEKDNAEREESKELRDGHPQQHEDSATKSDKKREAQTREKLRKNPKETKAQKRRRQRDKSAATKEAQKLEVNREATIEDRQPVNDNDTILNADGMAYYQDSVVNGHTVSLAEEDSEAGEPKIVQQPLNRSAEKQFVEHEAKGRQSPALLNDISPQAEPKSAGDSGGKAEHHADGMIEVPPRIKEERLARDLVKKERRKSAQRARLLAAEQNGEEHPNDTVLATKPPKPDPAIPNDASLSDVASEPAKKGHQPSADSKELTAQAHKNKKRKTDDNRSISHSNKQQPRVATPTSQHVSPSKPSHDTAIPPVKPPNLTPMQQKMSDKLISSRFRHLNETLYTTPSTSAQSLFSTDPSAYETYHSGFRAQVRSWPSNPLESFITELRHRAEIRPSRPHSQNHAEPSSPKIDPLPRDSRSKICKIADLGCGDAHLASTLHSDPKKKRYSIEISSFDLARPKGANALLVTKADITSLSGVGVKNMSFHLAICCLSLMGTNWVSVVDECARILVRGGECWIAEVKSRFRRKYELGKDKDKGKDGGKADKGRKARGKEVEEGEEGDWREELQEKDADETDVTAFVEVFKRRGFEVKGGVEKGNKMFVIMRFVKVGRAGPGMQQAGQGQEAGKKRRFGDVEDEWDRERRVSEEGKVLKPCVYKTR